MIEKIKGQVIKRIKLKLGVNKLNEIIRLLYEIHKREHIDPSNILDEKDMSDIINHQTLGYLNKFAKIKKYLISRRFPNASLKRDFIIYFDRLKLTEGKKNIVTYHKEFYPKSISIENDVKNSGLAKRIKDLFPDISVRYIDTVKDLIKDSKTSMFDLRKRDLIVTKHKWDFLKPCPCSKNVVCCNYHIFNLGFGCPFDCSYCFLQHYTNFPGIIIDANLEDFFDKVDEYLNKFGKKAIRIGTGEFTDSLALDNITEYSKDLVPFFSKRSALLELKTKSNNISNLMNLNHNEKTVISWSLNPQNIIDKEELGTASLENRLISAKKCRDEGYKIGFHFDPIIYYKGWEKDYEAVVNKMFDSISEIAWISLGALRFHRSLKNIIENRFPNTDYIYEEMIIGQDKKIRYYFELRKDIFKKMIDWIKKRNKKTPVYLCMEPKEMWRGQTLTTDISWMRRSKIP